MADAPTNQDALIPESELGPELREVTFIFKATRTEILPVGEIPSPKDEMRGVKVTRWVVVAVNRKVSANAVGQETVVVSLEPYA